MQPTNKTPRHLTTVWPPHPHPTTPPEKKYGTIRKKVRTTMKSIVTQWERGNTKTNQQQKNIEKGEQEKTMGSFLSALSPPATLQHSSSALATTPSPHHHYSPGPNIIIVCCCYLTPAAALAVASLPRQRHVTRRTVL